MTQPTQAQTEAEARWQAKWQTIANQGIHIETQLRKELLTIELATIERCAQVAENLADNFDPESARIIRDVAAVIRKLRDAP